MKLKTFICSGVIAIAAGAGITAAVEFSDISKQNSPYLKVVTKETYQQLMQQQGVNTSNVATTPVSIDYGSLPTSGVNFIDLLSQNKIKGNSFIITVGSEAYSQTRKILYDANAVDNIDFSTNISSSSLMLKLYDLFYNDRGADNKHNVVAEYAKSMTFYSFIDIAYSTKTQAASQLLWQRATQEGDKFPETIYNGSENPLTGQDQVAMGQSKLWTVPVKKESTKTQDLPVVKSSSGSSTVNFVYEPTDAYYEYRPDNKLDTKYEKVYFRDQKEVSLYNDTISWASSYASSFLPGAEFSAQGSVVCAKKNDKGQWLFKSFTTASDSTLDDIISFYDKAKEREDEKKEEQAQNDSSQPSDGSEAPQPSPDQSAAPAPASYRLNRSSRVVSTPLVNDKK